MGRTNNNSEPSTLDLLAPVIVVEESVIVTTTMGPQGMDPALLWPIVGVAVAIPVLMIVAVVVLCCIRRPTVVMQKKSVAEKDVEDGNMKLAAKYMVNEVSA